MGYLFLVIALLLNAAANIMMKLGAGHLDAVDGHSLLMVIPKFFTNFYLIAGLVLYVLDLVFYVVALAKINLSIAYPIMASGGFLLITLFSFYYLKENITMLQVTGIVLMSIGITLVAYNIH